MEISRTGLRVRTPIAIDEGRPIALTLSYRDDTVRLRGIVRWRREAGFVSDDDTLAFWEVGIALTEIGEVSPDGIWRTLSIHGRGSTRS